MGHQRPGDPATDDRNVAAPVSFEPGIHSKQAIPEDPIWGAGGEIHSLAREVEDTVTRGEAPAGGGKGRRRGPILW